MRPSHFSFHITIWSATTKVVYFRGEILFMVSSSKPSECTYQWHWYLRLSLKSSTRIISLMRCSGLLLRTLTMVRRRVERASLWKVMMTEVGGNCSCSQAFALHAPLRVSGTSLLLATFNWYERVESKLSGRHFCSPCLMLPGWTCSLHTRPLLPEYIATNIIHGSRHRLPYRVISLMQYWSTNHCFLIPWECFPGQTQIRQSISTRPLRPRSHPRCWKRTRSCVTRRVRSLRGRRFFCQFGTRLRLVYQCDATDNRIQGVFSGCPWLTTPCLSGKPTPVYVLCVWHSPLHCTG